MELIFGFSQIAKKKLKYYHSSRLLPLLTQIRIAYFKEAISLFCTTLLQT